MAAVHLSGTRYHSTTNFDVNLVSLATTLCPTSQQMFTRVDVKCNEWPSNGWFKAAIHLC